MESLIINTKDSFKGKIISAWVGQSKDKDILNNSQIGGVASAIILNALENDIMVYSSYIQGMTVFTKGLKEKRLLVHALALHTFKCKKTLFDSLKRLIIQQKIISYLRSLMRIKKQ